MRIRVSDQLKTVLALYDQVIEQKNMPPSYRKFRTTVKTLWDKKTRTRIFEARNVKNRDGSRSKEALKGSREIAISGQQEGKCTKGDAFSFSHGDNKRLKKSLQNCRRTAVGVIHRKVASQRDQSIW